MLPQPAVRLPWFRRMDPHLFARDVARLAPDTGVLVPAVLKSYDLQGLVDGSDPLRG
jgi:hypothetical protein